MSHADANEFIDSYLNNFIGPDNTDYEAIAENMSLDSQECDLEDMYKMFRFLECALNDFYVTKVRRVHMAGKENENSYISFDDGFMQMMWTLYFEKYHNYLDTIMIEQLQLTGETNIMHCYDDFVHNQAPRFRLLRSASNVYKMMLLGFGAFCFDEGVEDDDESVYMAQKMLGIVVHMERAIVLKNTRPLGSFAQESVWIDWLCLRRLRESADKEARIWAKNQGQPTIPEAIHGLPDRVKEPFFRLLYPCFPEDTKLSPNLIEKINDICSECIRDHDCMAEEDEDEDETETENGGQNLKIDGEEEGGDDEKEADQVPDTKNESESGVMVEDEDYNEATPLVEKKNV
jgi:hypothetical protein